LESGQLGSRNRKFYRRIPQRFTFKKSVVGYLLLAVKQKLIKEVCAMNKAELVEEVVRQTGLAKKMCKKTVDSVVSTITDSLAKREKVTLVGFGSFKVITRKSRRGRNPQTGEEIQIPTKEVPKFAPGKNLKEAVL